MTSSKAEEGEVSCIQSRCLLELQHRHSHRQKSSIQMCLRLCRMLIEVVAAVKWQNSKERLQYLSASCWSK